MFSIDLIKVLDVHQVKPKRVLHIGAHLAQELSIYKSLGCSSGIFVEADPVTSRELSASLENENNFEAIEACLSDKSGELVEFFRASNHGVSSSILRPAMHLAKYPEIEFNKNTLQLVSKCLDDLNLGTFDLVVLDVQGAELKVLRGGMETIKDAKALMIEVSIIRLYEGDSHISEIVEFLTPFGFSPVALNVFAEGWGDCLFIRGNIDGRASSRSFYES